MHFFVPGYVNINIRVGSSMGGANKTMPVIFLISPLNCIYIVKESGHETF